MILIIDQMNRDLQSKVLRGMFEARKHVFVDLLKWNLPVLAGRFEVDHFDDGEAIYLIVSDPAGRHLASARLLATTRPALLDSLYPDLVDGPAPSGTDILEITRFCLSPGIGARLRREARDSLLVGLAEYALAQGISSYTGVAEHGWFEQICTFGWRCRALGPSHVHDGRLLTGLRIDIDDDTIGQLADQGIRAAADVPAARAA
ncbi:MAG: autoinducer synthase [Sphingomonadales bacterium]|nr:MAG: autoinducer synthase [Sphingomonadales bacterium]